MKSKFIKSSIILIIGGFISKILSLVTRIALTRSIGEDGVGFYSMILPTFNLFITLCTFSLSVGISKLVSEGREKSYKIVGSIMIPVVIYIFFLMIIIVCGSPIISNIFLKNSNTLYPLICISVTLPFICISNLLRGYYFGKERMGIHIFSILVEQMVRLLLTIFFIPTTLKYNMSITICFVVLLNVLSEFSACFVLLLFLPKGDIKLNNFKYNKNYFDKVMGISIPATMSRLIGSFTYFLEPIILIYVLKKLGYTSSYITREYGIINGYVYPIVLLPSFFSMAISSALLPVISKNYINKNYKYCKTKLKQGILLSLMIGIPCTIIFILCPQILLNFIYNTKRGIKYIRILAPFFILHYIQAPLTTCLQAMNKSKCSMNGTLYSSIIKLVSLFIFSYFKIGLWGLIISSIINIIFVTLHHAYFVKKYLNE